MSLHFPYDTPIKPAKYRGAFVTFDVPAAVGQAGGCAWVPAGMPCVIDFMTCTADAGAASDWRWGILTQAEWGAAPVVAAGGFQVKPIWPDPPAQTFAPSGAPFAFTGINIGDRYQITRATPVFSYPILVAPGNVFFMALTGANLTSEGGFVVHEFVSPEEFTLWNGSSDGRRLL